MTNGIVFCQIKSWITGNRLVSLPFADHCEPLFGEANTFLELTEWMRGECDRQRWKYIELRPPSWEADSNFALLTSRAYWLHTLDLSPALEQIFGRLHKNSLQRRIRRAEREKLFYETGRSKTLVDEFYCLLLITRKRHHLLPQPYSWFLKLAAYMGENLQIRVARKDGKSIAAILTLRHCTTIVYKYGCSDERFHHLAAMPFLFWNLIKESKASGAEQIDFGRTDLDNDGLITFKDRFGAARKRLTYFRYPENAKEKGVMAYDLPAVRRLFSTLPNAVLPWAGRLVYRHIG